MINRGKHNVIGVMVDTVDYESAVSLITGAAQHGDPYTVSALAVHGVMTGVLDVHHKFRLNSFNLIVADGQPVRWALNLLHRAGLSERVYGPELSLRLLKHAAEQALPVYFYGTTPEILQSLRHELQMLFPTLVIAGTEASKFRVLDAEERTSLAERVMSSGAKMVFVGLGCPRQEIFLYEMRDLIPMPMIAVGAAFAFIAGRLPQAPPWLQQYGLEWMFRLKQEPMRLWRRYLYLNPYYVLLLIGQAFGRKVSTSGTKPLAIIGHG